MQKLLYLMLGVSLSLSALGQCSNFGIISDKSSVCAPELVQFQVDNAIDSCSYQWDLGQGWINGSKSVITLYDQAGTYDISLRITLPDGSICSLSEKDFITVYPKPQAVIDASSFVLCNGPEELTFIDASSNSFSRNWIIDGTNYINASKTISHKFTNTGTKSISLIITDSFGCQGVTQYLDTIQVYEKPEFDIKFNKTRGCVPQQISMEVLENKPYAGTYTWSLDGTTSNSASGKNIGPYTYGNPGFFDVILNLQADNGCSYKVEKLDYLRFGKAQFFQLNMSNTTLCKGDAVDLKLNPSKVQGQIKWSYSGPSLTHESISDQHKKVYPKNSGNLGVDIEVNYNGCSSKKSFSGAVVVKEVRANFSSDDNYHCQVPHSVHLDNKSDKMDADSLSFIWNVYAKDSLIYSSNAINDSLVFNSMPATYDVELIAIGNNGCTDTAFRKGFIYQDSLRVKFSAEPDIGCVGQLIDFRNNSKRSTAFEEDEFRWTFFDKDGSILDSSDQRDAYMTYADTGFYSAELIGFNSFGCRDTFELEAVQIIDPIIEFSMSDSIICLGQSISLKANNTPMLADMVHLWILEHKDSGEKREFQAEELDLTPWAIGSYSLSYSFKIKDGCYREIKKDIEVNGIEGEIILDSMQACSPFVLEPEFSIQHNQHFGQSSGALNYHWSVNPEHYSIDDSSAIKPAIQLLKNGLYTLELRLENSSSCIANFELPGIQAGVIAELDIEDNIICLGDSFTVYNLSENQNCNYRYELSPSANYEVFKHGDFDQVYSPDSGLFTLSLIAEKDGLCSDTASLEVEVIQLVADFVSNDTFLKCAPVYVQFQSKSTNYDSLYWDFGDGQKYATTEDMAGNIYMSNTGDTEGFDVRLIARNKEGCVDSMLRKDFISVSGPKPKFEFQDPKACDSALVVFKDLSQASVFYAMDYGDGSPLDSNFSQHLYKKLSDDATETFYPTLYASDNNGCVAKYSSPTPVTLHQSPSLDFSWDDPASHCAILQLDIINNSRHADQWNWSIDDSPTSILKEPSFVFEHYGLKEIKLTASNAFGCSAIDSTHFRVEGTPELNIEVKDSLCLYNNIQFNAQLELNEFFDTTGMKILWDFGQIGHPERMVEGELSPYFTYEQSGPKLIRLNIELANGCKDSSDLEIYLRGFEELDNPQFKSLSFASGYQLDISHEITNDKAFAAYHFERSDGETYQNSNQFQSSWIYDFVSQPDSSLCYDLNVVDHCGLFGIKSIRHCFIHLQISSTQDFQNKLEWSPYIGWEKVDEYQIFRRKAGESFEMIATVDGLKLQFIDDGLCKEEYEYFVRAINTDKDQKANSFVVMQLPKSDPTPLKTSIANASVMGENKVEIRWNSVEKERLDHFILSKYQDDQSVFLESIPLNDTTFIDSEVNTSEHSYIYTIQQVDLCGEKSLVDRIGKTIVLEAIYDNPNLEANLDWTAYEEWKDGVYQYHIELVSTQNSGILGSTGPNVLNYTDGEIRNTDDGDYCYRIAALNQESDTSYSNTVCVHGDPMAYIPTAFSPNQDGLNDRFRPITRFIDHQAELSGYQLEIYNRWGEQIYQSNDLFEGWDGSYKGVACQQDVYIFKIQYRGANQRLYNHRGTVTLVK